MNLFPEPPACDFDICFEDKFNQKTNMKKGRYKTKHENIISMGRLKVFQFHLSFGITNVRWYRPNKNYQPTKTMHISQPNKQRICRGLKVIMKQLQIHFSLGLCWRPLNPPKTRHVKTMFLGGKTSLSFFFVGGRGKPLIFERYHEMIPKHYTLITCFFKHISQPNEPGTLQPELPMTLLQ